MDRREKLKILKDEKLRAEFEKRKCLIVDRKHLRRIIKQEMDKEVRAFALKKKF